MVIDADRLPMKGKQGPVASRQRGFSFTLVNRPPDGVTAFPMEIAP